MKQLTQLLTKGTLACLLALAAGIAHTQAADSPAKPDAVTAIDILLEPDATMLKHAEANNARLLKEFPKGFALDAMIIDYVSTFVPKMSGENFNPHVSTGVASPEYLDRMLAEPFESFTFSPAGAAVYQLGPFGTAAKKLKEWDLKR